MQVRIIGAADIIERIESALSQAGIEARRYPSHRGPDVRLYVTIDDREAERLTSQLSSHLAPEKPARKRATKAERLADSYRHAGMYQPQPVTKTRGKSNGK